MIKIIFSDLDGTLRKEKTISKNNLDAIKKYSNLGNLFVVTTGRSVSYIRKLFNDTEEIRYIISNNGSIIYDNKNKGVIYYNKIKYEDIYKIDKLCKLYGAKLLICGLDYDYVNKNPIYNQKLYKNIDEKLYENNCITQLIIVSEEKDVMKNIIKKIDDFNLKVVNRSKSLYDNSIGNSYWINVCNNNDSKGNAVKYLCNYLSIKLSDTLRVGDELNDISMFFNEGINVSVLNGTKELKDKADFIATSCDKDAISYIIDKIIYSANSTK